jgi:ABC-type multidrug transport system fused ATPase/permease subunit
VAKNFRQETGIYQEFDAANRQSYRVNVQRGLVLSAVFPVLNALGGVGMAILVYVGGLSAAAGAISAGAWYLFLLSLDQFFFPVLNLSAFWAQVQAGLSAAERIFALIDAEPRRAGRQPASAHTARRSPVRRGGLPLYHPGGRRAGGLRSGYPARRERGPGGPHRGGKSSVAKLLALLRIQGDRFWWMGSTSAL